MKLFLISILMSVPLVAIAQNCGSDKVLVFKDGKRDCASNYAKLVSRTSTPTGTDSPVPLLELYDTYRIFSFADSFCGASGTRWNASGGWYANDQGALNFCNGNLSVARRDNPERFKDCKCELVISAEQLGKNLIKIDIASEKFSEKYSSANASSDLRVKKDYEDRQLAAERARLEAEKQALEKARQAKLKEDEDRQKERARLEADRQLLEKTRLAQIKETEQRNREIARLEAEAKVRDQKMRAELQSRTTTVDERFQQGKATGSAGSWAIYKSGVPFQQQQFCRITENFRQEIEDAKSQKNQIKENVAFRTREQRLTALMPDGNFSNWIVRAVSVKQASDGSAAVLFELPCDVVIGSHACGQNAKSFIGTISENSRLYTELVTISVGDFLGVSGNFNFVDEKAAFQKGRSVASFRSMLADSHCEAKDVAKPGSDFFASSIATLSNLK
jgi:hypothetical protein